MSALKIGILFAATAVSLYIGFRLGRIVMPVLYDMDYYEYTPPLEYAQALYRYYYFLVGVLVTDRWVVLNRTPFPVVCFGDPSELGDANHHQRIVDRIVESGLAWISTTDLAGQPCIRACIISHRTTPTDIDALVQLLGDARP